LNPRRQNRSTSKTIVHCRRVFAGVEDAPRSDQIFVVERSLITHLDLGATAPCVGEADTVLDASEHFAMPSLVAMAPGCLRA
jgi:hypothetical protein